MHKTVELTLASAVANGGTFTVGYPTGTGPGNFERGTGHYLIAIGGKFDLGASAGISIAYAAAQMTVTYNGATTIPAESEVVLHLDMTGQEDLDLEKMSFSDLNDNVAVNVSHLGVVKIDLGSPDVADPNGVCASQTINTTASLDGALVSDGEAVFDVPRNVVAAWTTTATLTFTGVDVYGNTMVEVSASGTSHTGTKAFKKLTGVTSSVSVSSATVGTGDVLGLPVYMPDADNVVREMEDGIALGTHPPQRIFLPFEIEATELAAGTAEELRSPVAGTITRLVSTVQETVGTGGALTVEVNTTAVDGLSVTVASSAAAGDLDSDTPTAGHASTTVAVDDRIEIIPSAAFATSGALNGYLEIEVDSALRGTLVAGLAEGTAATTSNADVRGTYTPNTTPDGDVAFEIWALLPDPKYTGVAQATS